MQRFRTVRLLYLKDTTQHEYLLNYFYPNGISRLTMIENIASYLYCSVIFLIKNKDS